MANILWQEATCPICGDRFKYLKGGYRSMTCNKSECALKYAHPELKKRRR